MKQKLNMDLWNINLNQQLFNISRRHKMTAKELTLKDYVEGRFNRLVIGVEK